MTTDNDIYAQDIMRFAYADPPYPGQANRWYRDQANYAGEVDHAELVTRLDREFPDGWALSTSAPALRHVLELCPVGVRVAIWSILDSEPPGNRGRWWWSWEPVIISGGRLYGQTVRDLHASFKINSQAKARILPGQKPPSFCRWVLDLLGYRDGDELVDLYPGSGVMGAIAAQGRLVV